MSFINESTVPYVVHVLLLPEICSGNMASDLRIVVNFCSSRRISVQVVVIIQKLQKQLSR